MSKSRLVSSPEHAHHNAGLATSRCVLDLHDLAPRALLTCCCLFYLGLADIFCGCFTSLSRKD